MFMWSRKNFHFCRLESQDRFTDASIERPHIYLQCTLERMPKFSIKVRVYQRIQCRIEVTNPKYDADHNAWRRTRIAQWRNNVPERRIFFLNIIVTHFCDVVKLIGAHTTRKMATSTVEKRSWLCRGCGPLFVHVAFLWLHTVRPFGCCHVERIFHWFVNVYLTARLPLLTYDRKKEKKKRLYFECIFFIINQIVMCNKSIPLSISRICYQ